MDTLVQESGMAWTTNGDVAYTAKGVNSSLLALFFKLVRNLDPEMLQSLLRPVLDDVRMAASKPQADAKVLDLFLLMANTRGVRGGKGEKDLFHELFFAVGKQFPNQCVDLLKDGIVHEVGSFKDVKVLYNQSMARLARDCDAPSVVRTQEHAHQERVSQERETVFLRTVSAECIRVFWKQLEADVAVLEAHEKDASENAVPPKLSLAAKWAPRETKKQWKHMAKVLALQMFPHSGEKGEDGILRALKKYRKLVVRLNAALGTCEVKMGNGEWSTIDPGTVPSQCLKRKRNAFMNLPNKTGGDAFRSKDADRVQCAENFKRHLEDGKSLHGRAVHVNEIVAGYFGNPAEDPILEAQWRDIREEFLEMDGDIRKYVVMADVSDSMFSGGGQCRLGPASPIVCCVALSLLISEVAHPVFRNKVLTFDANPTWFNFNEGDSLAKKVAHIQSAPWGLNTDFYSGMQHVVQSCVEAGLTEEELPKGLVVFSDMQFDRAMHGGMADCMSQIESLWQANGYASAPKVVFWNLAASTTSFPAKSDTENVQMLSGFSQNLMKAFLNDTELEEVTPEATLRNALSEQWLDNLRRTFKPDSTTLEGLSTVAQRERVQGIEALLAE
jgi:hypothetical protein